MTILCPVAYSAAKVKKEKPLSIQLVRQLLIRVLEAVLLRLYQITTGKPSTQIKDCVLEPCMFMNHASLEGPISSPRPQKQ